MSTQTEQDFVEITAADTARIEAIAARVKGWSMHTHYLFFKAVLAQWKPIDRLLMLGVYHGRDIAFILDILKTYHPGRKITIVGVDRFTDDACADWTQTKETRTWEQEVFAPPPSFEAAVENTRDPRVEIIRSDDFAYLDRTEDKFDLVYVDTSHDFNTVTRQLRQIPRVCNGNAFICGDDYEDRHTWGVRSAVTQAFTTHKLYANWIWFANRNDLKSQCLPSCNSSKT